MPLYEYSCDKCQKTFEVIQKFSDAPLESCSECNGKVSKLISRTSFQLKGTGWYATDYKASSSPAPKSVTSEAAAKVAPPIPDKAKKDGK